MLALVDSDPSRVTSIARNFPRARGFSTPRAAYDAIQVDLTLITSPPGLHLDHGLTAISAGSHLLVEKPMVTSAGAAEQLCTAAAAANRILAVGMPRRYYPHIAEVSQLLAAGELGSPVAFVYREGGPYNWPVASDAVFKRALSGGGVLMDKGVHALDVLDQLFGRAEVLKCEDDSLTDGVEANSRVELRYPDTNASGVLQLSWDQPLRNGLWIRGMKEELWLGLDEINYYRRRKLGGKWREQRAAVTWPADLRKLPARRSPSGYLACIDLEWIGVVRAVLHGEAPAATGLSSARVIRVIECAYAEAEPLELPWLSTAERTVLRRRHWRAGP